MASVSGSVRRARRLLGWRPSLRVGRPPCHRRHHRRRPKATAARPHRVRGASKLSRKGQLTRPGPLPLLRPAAASYHYCFIAAALKFSYSSSSFLPNPQARYIYPGALHLVPGRFDLIPFYSSPGASSSEFCYAGSTESPQTFTRRPKATAASPSPGGASAATKFDWHIEPRMKHRCVAPTNLTAEGTTN